MYCLNFRNKNFLSFIFLNLSHLARRTHTPIYTYKDTHTHTHTYTHTHTQTHTPRHTHTHIYIPKSFNIPTHTHKQTNTLKHPPTHTHTPTDPNTHIYTPNKSFNTHTQTHTHPHIYTPKTFNTQTHPDTRWPQMPWYDGLDVLPGLQRAQPQLVVLVDPLQDLLKQ